MLLQYQQVKSCVASKPDNGFKVSCQIIESVIVKHLQQLSEQNEYEPDVLEMLKRNFEKIQIDFVTHMLNNQQN